MNDDFGSNFDLGSFDDIAAVDLGNLSDVDFGSNFDLGSFEDLAAADMGNIDFGSNFDLGSFEDLLSADLAGLDNIDFGSNFDLGSFEDLLSADLGDLSGGRTRSLFGDESNLEINPRRVAIPNIDSLPRDEQGFEALVQRLGGEGDSDKFDGAGQPDNPLYSDTSEDVQPWQNLEGSGTTQLSDAYKYEDGKWSIRGNYDEETGRFVPDPNGTFTANEENGFDPLRDSGTNAESMKDYTYDKKTGTWTTPSGQVYTPKVTPTHTTQSGAQVQVNAGSLPSGYAGLTPGKGSTASTTNTGKGGDTKTTTPAKTPAGMGALLPLLLALLAMNRGGGGGGGSKGAVIPGLTATQRQTPYAQQQRAPGYRPGQGGINYFEQTQFAPRMAAGGGIGGLLNGPGDGVSDSIPAVIDGNMADGGQPAQVARGEYIMDARTVAALGNGSTDAGAERLDKMRENILRDDKKTGVGEDSKAYRHLMA